MDEYLIKIVGVVSKRESCLFVCFVAVIVKDSIIQSTGYVGTPREAKDCFEKDNCLRRKLNTLSSIQYELCISVHAEQNAIINAARDSTSTLGGIHYI